MRRKLNDFQIEEIQEDQYLQEEMGSKPKFWFNRSESEDELWLFKYHREGRGEHWAEKVASEVAELLNIPHAIVELAVFRQTKGTATKSFTDRYHELIHGNQLLSFIFNEYEPEKVQKQSDHTLFNIWSVLEAVFEQEKSESAKQTFCEYITLDAFIGNTDRHHENWGVLMDFHMVSKSVAPSYDHASSLGREINDDRRIRLLEEDRVGRYSEKGRSPIYRSSEDTRGLSPLGVVRTAFNESPGSFSAVLQRLDQLDESSLEEIVNRIPDDWMSIHAREFAMGLMLYNREKLLEIDS
ncbi:MAG: hypothetical protein F4X08_13210 [Gemmatimonadetes bacterium]|nr:hypothetical protein [Gemmatimonadota bacterium]